ncbi:neurofilament medium polypeptide-like [Penaeus japonicus]|uniref:neurofilament medium polypeptide-like n=1 Tax=Penaeus japonicus TaxID=27405 RepID=UPI001C7177CB|nr:neurofilament medium polypeptide-like [Penaeus japonicus]
MKVLQLQIALVLFLAGTAWCKCKYEEGYREVGPCVAKRMYVPLCGSDGCTYVNEDVFKCAEKQDRDRNLSEEEVVKIVFRGRCEDMPDEDQKMEKKGNETAEGDEEGAEGGGAGEERTKEGEEEGKEEGEEEGEEGSQNRLFP